ncbi:MAG: CBS domain-containing protein [Longimicrobiales bacterium]
MRLADLLPAEHVIVPLEAETLADALAVLMRRIAESGAVRERTMLEGGLIARAADDVVLIGDDVAFPHWRTRAVDHVVLALGVAPQPLRPPGDRAGAPRIIVLVLAPPEQTTLYLQTVSALARLLRQDGVVADLLAARSPDDVLGIASLARIQLQAKLTVRDLMVHSDSVVPETPAREAVDLMVRGRIRALPVINDKQEVLGIVSEWDVMRGLLPQVPRTKTDDETPAASTAQLTVRDIMTRSVLCVSEDLGIEEAASIMVNKNLEHFPVVREGKLTGFLSRSDIIRKLFGHGSA